MGELRRSLGLTGLTFYGIGLILGAGIYSILGPAAGIAGDALWMSFLLASVAALLTGLSYAELATMFPRAGAEYVYARAAWPKWTWLPGTLGWLLVLAACSSMAAVAEAFAGYAARVVDLPAWLLAGAVIALAVGINIVGIVEANWANVAFTLIEAGGLVAVIAVGVRSAEMPRVLATPPHGGVLAGASLIFFAYLGFEELANLAEEARDPGRDLPRAILISVAVTTTLYVLVAMAAVALLDPAALASSSSPLAEAMQVGAPRLVAALDAVALFATANTVFITVTATSRLLLSMSRGGDAPALLARTHQRRHTPVPAILVSAIGAALFLTAGGVAIIGSVASLLALAAFAMVDLALIRLRRTQPQASRSFRVPMAVAGIPLPTVLGLAVVVILMTRFPPRVYLIAAIACLTAFAIQAPFLVRRRLR